ncbi:MAG: efflux RND transporter periplasmic adaptor subunit [Nitrospira sp.]|nr:efflux RND transporter periplasmic adaptor subunit [Nitrospira sp.]
MLIRQNIYHPMPLYKRFSFYIFVFALLGIAAFIVNKTFKAVEIKTVRVERQNLTVTVTATSTGTIKADEEVRLTAQRIGRISKLYIKEGSLVKAGDLVAEIDPDETMYNLQMAQAALQRMQARLDELKAAYNPLRIEVETTIDKAKANLQEAEKRLKRFMDLSAKGYISQIEVDSMQRDHDVAKATYESALSGREQLIARAEEIKAQEAAVREAKNYLSLARLNYDYSFVSSPLSGVVTSVPVKIGDTAAKGTLMASVVSTDSLYIEAFIDEADIAKVSKGQRVHVSMDAYPDRIFEGEVYMISPIVLGGKQEARTFEVRVILNQVQDKERGITVKPGMSADVEIIVDSVKDKLVVPSQAIIERSGGKFVFVKRGSIARVIPVKTGLYNWNLTEIVSGLKEGDIVATNPDTPGLEDRARVKEK